MKRKASAFFPLAACVLVLALCAFLPAGFLAATDAARLDRATPQAQLFTAAEPDGGDYYLLCQLSLRMRLVNDNWTDTHERKPFYVSPGDSIGGMTDSWQMRDTADGLLAGLVKAEVLPTAWADAALAWPEYGQAVYTDYSGREYDLSNAYYSVDTCGFVTFRRYALFEGCDTPRAAFSLTMDSQTGQVVSLWVSSPGELAAPGRDALEAYIRLAGLDSLGDWDVPEGTRLQNALYSRRGQALISCASNRYSPSNSSGKEPMRWYLSFSVTPSCSEADLLSLAAAPAASTP